MMSYIVSALGTLVPKEAHNWDGYKMKSYKSKA